MKINESTKKRLLELAQIKESNELNQDIIRGELNGISQLQHVYNLIWGGWNNIKNNNGSSGAGMIEDGLKLFHRLLQEQNKSNWMDPENIKNIQGEK